MSDSTDRLNELAFQAAVLPHGPAKVALLEEAVRVADAHGDDEAGFDLRKELMSAATFSGRPDVMLVAFSWCLGLADREPARFPEGMLLWQYKWVLQNVTDFPDVSRAKFDELFADATVRFLRAGSNLHALHQIRRDKAWDFGDKAAAVEAHARFRRVRRDWLSNCPACVLSAGCDHLVRLGRNAQAVATAAPILDGRLSCGTVPQNTLATLLVPLLKLGRTDEAREYHLRGLRMALANPSGFVVALSHHLTFMALTDNLPRAVKLFESQSGVGLGAAPSERLEFLLASRFLLRRLADAGKASVKLRLPEDFPARRPDGKYAVAELAAWYDGELAELARRFDARNGNDRFSRRVADQPKLAKWATPVALTNRKADGGEAE